MICHDCGRLFPDDLNFCPVCKAPVLEGALQKIAQQWEEALDEEAGNAWIQVLDQVPLPQEFISPTLRDGCIYSNMMESSLENLPIKLHEAKERIDKDIAIINQHTKAINDLVEFPLYALPAHYIEVIDAAFKEVDPGYERLGAHAPQVPLYLYHAALFINSRKKSLKNNMLAISWKFPDIWELWEKPITSASLKVLEIISKADVYVRRAQYLNGSSHQLSIGGFKDIIELQAARASYNRYSAPHLGETAPFLDDPNKWCPTTLEDINKNLQEYYNFNSTDKSKLGNINKQNRLTGLGGQMTNLFGKTEN